jgi:hypothetical protein
LQLAILLGVGMNLATDINGMKLVEDARYSYSESEHGFSFSDIGNFDSNHIKLLRILSAHSPKVSAHVNGALKLINECLWAAERNFAH